MADLHTKKYIIKLKQGLASAINKLATVNSAVQGEPHYATDTEHLYIFNGTLNKPVQTLDRAVIHEGDVVTHNGSIVYA